jgi:hypothetical protein
MIGEQHGMDRPDLTAEPLQREHRGGIADVAASDMRVDGEEIHMIPPIDHELRRRDGILPRPIGERRPSMPRRLRAETTALLRTK